MSDRLVELLKCFSLKARVFQTGPLCHSASFDQVAGVGYIHVLQTGRLQVRSQAHAALQFDEPVLFLYMNPTTHHLTPQGPDVEMVCASFEFGAGLNTPLARALPDVVVIRLADIPALDRALSLLFIEAGEHHCGQQAILNRMMEVIIVLVLRDLMDQHRLQFGLLAGLADDRLARAINAMHAEPAREWSLEALAETANMSRARFANRFREVVGTTPGAYLGEWRLTVAQSLLRQGKPVQYVADVVGYGSASALSRSFRAHVGQSPREWLKADQALGGQINSTAAYARQERRG
ncbi:AraC family transcriptional regulator [Sedimenticola selenatireducens]|uniref:AraC family transcriptional regulator n=1 Tax=Sedimenticola selenatireducens TaxID=191960 RepID=UPI0004B3C785|nr:cupin domain-containing protein [Sedimenticola selenatireducens]